MTKAQKAEKTEAIAKFKELVQNGDTLSTALYHTSRSGMLRSIDVVTCIRNDQGRYEPFSVAWLAARILDRKFDRDNGGVRCSGAGMDMGFELVYSLARVVYGDGYALNHKWL